MLKHATLTRSSRAQPKFDLHEQWHTSKDLATDVVDGAPVQHPAADHWPDRLPLVGNDVRNGDENNNGNNKTLIDFDGKAASPIPLHLNDVISPRPPLLASPIKSPLFETLTRLESTPSPSFTSSTLTRPSSSRKHLFNNSQCVVTRPKCGISTDSVIKVYAQTLSQDVEYITLHVNTQTKSQEIVKSLLKKFRLKHRDPNLFYLLLERYIRKDGLKCKSVMLLSDESCPLQLKQCCSNDAKFTLQMRAGTLVKIFCYDVAPNARYKCLSLSSHTTVDDTIELMLHCLNLVAPSTTISNTTTSINSRINGSPSPTSSSVSSNSSSSGIESEPNNHHNASYPSSATDLLSHHHQLDSDSRASSVTSISSTSNISNISSSIIDQYCMVIDCKDRNFKRMLDSDEYLVDVYQNMNQEAKGQPVVPSQYLDVVNGNLTIEGTVGGNQNSDQWFFIKLMRRSDYKHETIKFTHPRQMPLPPIPMPTLLSQFNNNAGNIVSTTQIEVSCRPGSRLAVMGNSNSEMCKQKADQAGNPTRAPPPPALIILPPVRPRRRNLSNATTTFVKPSSSICNRRRYDPSQLADDLNKLDFKEAEETSPVIYEEQPNQPPLASKNEIKMS